MGTYSTINHAIWDDDAFRALGRPARLLFVYSWTHSPMASITGLDYADELRLMNALDLDGSYEGDMVILEGALTELGQKPLVRYDWDHGLLWAVNRLKYVCPSKAKLTEPVQKAIKGHINRLPLKSPLVEDYLRKYDALIRA